MRKHYIAKRYVWINTDWCGYLTLFEYAPNNDCLLLICDSIDQIENSRKPAETKNNVDIFQMDDIRTKVCLKHNNMVLQYLNIEVFFLRQ